MEKKKNNKKSKKRFYKIGETVWVVADKESGKVLSLDLENYKVTVETSSGKKELKLHEIDKLKYKAKEKLLNKKYTYFSSVEGGIVPTKDKENAGRDCYARLEPTQLEDGSVVHELFIPQFKLAKIPLGFASYLNKDDLLSLKHERSSIGGTGLINVSGLIDSTYQGEVILQVIPITSNVLITDGFDKKFFDEANDTWVIPYSKAIAQAVVMKQSDAEDKEIPYESLLKMPSKRGRNGWGSTGK